MIWWKEERITELINELRTAHQLLEQKAASCEEPMKRTSASCLSPHLMIIGASLGKPNQKSHLLPMNPFNFLWRFFPDKQSWLGFIVNDLLLTEHVEDKSIESVTSTYTTESEFGQHELTMTKASISIRPHAEDNGVSYSCQAFHPALTVPMKSSVTLSVLYPPGPPEITGFPEGQTARMGDTVTLVCRSRGGNPLAQLVWYKNNEQVDFSYTTSTGRESINSHTFIADASDNNAVYRCAASSPLVSPSPMIASVRLTVYFLPAGVTIKVSPNRPKAGNKVELTCESGASHPVAEISWWKNGVRLLPLPDSVYNSTYGGKSTRSVLSLNVNAEEDGAVYTCKATNSILQQSVHGAITLSVLRKWICIDLLCWEDKQHLISRKKDSKPTKNCDSLCRIGKIRMESERERLSVLLRVLFIPFEREQEPAELKLRKGNPYPFERQKKDITTRLRALLYVPTTQQQKITILSFPLNSTLSSSVLCCITHLSIPLSYHERRGQPDRNDCDAAAVIMIQANNIQELNFPHRLDRPTLSRRKSWEEELKTKFISSSCHGKNIDWLTIMIMMMRSHDLCIFWLNRQTWVCKWPSFPNRPDGRGSCLYRRLGQRQSQRCSLYLEVEDSGRKSWRGTLHGRIDFEYNSSREVGFRDLPDPGFQRPGNGRDHHSSQREM